ncbi:hypothetical protein ACYCIM_27195, partial [Klebsiella pneumoniae]
ATRALRVSDIVVTLVKPSSDFESETLTSVTEKIRTAQKANAALEPWVLLPTPPLSDTTSKILPISESLSLCCKAHVKI